MSLLPTGENAILLIWVDDIILAAHTDSIKNLKASLSSKFKMKDFGTLSVFLGINFTQTEECITMSQAHYLENVLKIFNLSDCKPRSTPCEQNLKTYSESKSDENDNRKYRQMIGSLIYAMTCTSRYCIRRHQIISTLIVSGAQCSNMFSNTLKELSINT